MTVTDSTLARRAAANLVRGLAGSLPFALLPPMLGRLLPDAEFAVWLIVVQIASYVAYLEFGVQTAVSRTVAYASASGQSAAMARSVSAGLQLLTTFAAGALLLVIGGAAVLPSLFDIAPDLVTPARTSFLVLGTAAALALPGSAMHGALLGIGRNDVSAAVIVACRLCSVVLTLLAAIEHLPLTALAAALASGTLLNAIVPFFAAHATGLPIRLRGATRRGRRELIGLTLTLGIWTVATLIISGLDVVIVGVIDFERVAAYGLAASLIIIISAGYSIMFSVLLPAFAEFSGADRGNDAKRLLQRSTIVSSALLAAGLVLAFAVGPFVIGRWAGQYAQESGRIFAILLPAAVIRLSMTPLATFVMGAGDHRRVRVPAIVEAALNLGLSIVLGLAVGAAGVAAATLIAASVVGIVYLLGLAPSAIGIPAARRLVLEAYGPPAAIAAVAVPLILLRDTAVTAASISFAALGLWWVARTSMARARL